VHFICAQNDSKCQKHALVWWKSTTVPSLSSLDPHTPLHKHFPAQTFSLPNTPVAQDTSSQAHAVLIEELLGGPERMAARVGICANPAMVAAQLLRVRETWHQEVWARTGRVQLASAFMSSLLTGKWAAMGESEACATGIWVHRGNASAGPGQNFWDETVLDIVGGSREEGRRVRGWLGDVDVSGGARRVGHVSRYLVERYGFDPGIPFARTSCLKLIVCQKLSSRHLRQTTFAPTSPCSLPTTMLSFPLARWIRYLRRRNIICLHIFIIYSLILPRMPMKNANMLLC